MHQLLSTNPVVVQFTRSSSGKAKTLVGPAVRRILHHYRIHDHDIPASGPKKNVLKHDVLSFIDKKELQPVPKVKTPPAVPETAPADVISKPSLGRGEKFTDIPLTNMRKTIAKRLTDSKHNIPHSYVAADLQADKLTALRKKLAKDGVKVSVNDFLIKAVGLALRAVPEVNVQFKNDEIIRIPTVDVSVAVATPNGLITPIIAGADRLQVSDISAKIRDLAGRAKINKLALNEFQGGSFTISNLGMFGISNFTAIINPPQTAILAVGGTRLELGNDLTPHSLFSLTLCYDARAITELDAQRFVNHLELLIGNPDTMITDTTRINVSNIDLSALL
uniref:2-oxoacid_dh domain-containing protein n=1 Tax=Panagrellus redivivus TaxID=6233 RepID=A0A7E4ZT65_PANRE